MTIERLCDLLFEVSNEVRLTILQNLEEGHSNISTLSTELDISNQECSRHVSRLVDAELAERDSEGQYGLTEYGGLQGGIHFRANFFVVQIGYFPEYSPCSLPRHI